MRLFLPGQSVDSALDKNQPELGVFVLPVSLQMLPDGDCLLDKVVDILRQLRGHSLPLQDTQDLVAGDEPHLKLLKINILNQRVKTVRVPEQYQHFVSHLLDRGL